MYVSVCTYLCIYMHIRIYLYTHIYIHMVLYTCVHIDDAHTSCSVCRSMCCSVCCSVCCGVCRSVCCSMMHLMCIYICIYIHLAHTGWRRLMGSPKLQITFHKRATKYRSLLRKMTYKDKGSYESSPPCTNARETCINDINSPANVRVCVCVCGGEACV